MDIALMSNIVLLQNSLFSKLCISLYKSSLSLSLSLSVCSKNSLNFEIKLIKIWKFEKEKMQGEEVSIEELASNLATYKDQLHQVIFILFYLFFHY